MRQNSERTGDSSLGRGDIAALLGWWKLAGVDVVVASEPASWLGAAPPSQTFPPEKIPAARSGNSENWAELPTLDALRDTLLARLPNAPLADGNPASGVMLLGDAPSAEDLRSGRPFSGPAGLFLDKMLASIGLDRSHCYISLLCPRRRVPGPPSPDAISADLDLTRAHIRLVAPRLLVLLGANPVQALTGNNMPISRLRGNWLAVDTGAGTIPALATFNPAYLLRRPEEKAKAWADLLALRRRLFS